jgi:hypothetical protein
MATLRNTVISLQRLDSYPNITTARWPHTAIVKVPPISRLTNLAGQYS